MKHQKRDRWFVASLQAKRLREFRLVKSIFFHTAQADFSKVSVSQLKRGADRVVGEDTSDFPEFVSHPTELVRVISLKISIVIVVVPLRQQSFYPCCSSLRSCKTPASSSFVYFGYFYNALLVFFLSITDFNRHPSAIEIVLIFRRKAPSLCFSITLIGNRIYKNGAMFGRAQTQRQSSKKKYNESLHRISNWLFHHCCMA